MAGRRDRIWPALLAGLTLGVLLLLARPAAAQVNILNTPLQSGNAGLESSTISGNKNNTNQNQQLLGVGNGGSAQANAPGASATNTSSFASPNQTIQFGANNSQLFNVNPIGLPGILGMPAIFAAPIVPPGVLNGASLVRPRHMTYEKAKRCEKGLSWWDTDDKWTGDETGKRAASIELYYNLVPENYQARDKVGVLENMDNVLGTAEVQTIDTAWLASICRAARIAMDHGSTLGVVDWMIRMKSKAKGFGVGASVGGMGFPNGSAATASPYAFAGTAGFGTGVSSTYAQSQLLIMLTGLEKDHQTIGAAENPPSPLVRPATPAPPPAKMNGAGGSGAPAKIIIEPQTTQPVQIPSQQSIPATPQTPTQVEGPTNFGRR